MILSQIYCISRPVSSDDLYFCFPGLVDDDAVNLIRGTGNVAPPIESQPTFSSPQSNITTVGYIREQIHVNIVLRQQMYANFISD